MNYLKILFTLPVTVFFIFTSCQEEIDRAVTAPVVVNDFRMTVDGEEWIPDQLTESPCQAAYSCVFDRMEHDAPVENMYTIAAHKTIMENGHHLYTSTLLVAIADMTGPGLYYMDGTAGEAFVSRAFYTLYDPEGKKIKEYTSDFTRRPFYVDIHDTYVQDHIDDEAIYYLYDKGGLGIEGMMEGSLYNKEDLSEAVEITGGTFTFRKINGYTHCND